MEHVPPLLLRATAIVTTPSKRGGGLADEGRPLRIASPAATRLPRLPPPRGLPAPSTRSGGLRRAGGAATRRFSPRPPAARRAPKRPAALEGSPSAGAAPSTHTHTRGSIPATYSGRAGLGKEFSGRLKQKQDNIGGCGGRAGGRSARRARFSSAPAASQQWQARERHGIGAGGEERSAEQPTFLRLGVCTRARQPGSPLPSRPPACALASWQAGLHMLPGGGPPRGTEPPRPGGLGNHNAQQALLRGPAEGKPERERGARRPPPGLL